ncbi:MAG TPA: FtsQ-type POTRA domain-containing protein [Gaiellaceae bacterium]|nr:FtsQ-type POTRA domain-containing protein [Gaiellaceae bacterium]
MVTRPHLALVPANGLSGRLRTALVRVLGVLAVLLAVLGLAYAAARYTSLFALQELEVTGGSAAVNEAVRTAGQPFLGESLVAIDRDEVRRRLAALPTVRAVRVDRAFPHTLRVAVVPERALAVVRNGQEAWLVSERGRVIRAADSAAAARPLVWTASEPDLAPGATVQGENVVLALQALRLLPERFPERVVTARAYAGEITFVVAGGTEIRLGRADGLGLKLAVAARVLGSVTASERAELAYLDVSVPEKAVGGSSLDSQLEGET